MIVISRMKDEGIVIGDNIVVRILKVTGDTVELCIESLNETCAVDQAAPLGTNASQPELPRYVTTAAAGASPASWQLESNFASLLN